ncbi:MAG: cell division protein ZapA [Alphaproteobacteria bacterium]
MARVMVEIQGRNYPLQCAEGDEEKVRALASKVALKAQAIFPKNMAAPAENHLLVMTALMLADEIQDLRQQLDAAARITESDVMIAMVEDINGQLAMLANKLNQ